MNRGHDGREISSKSRGKTTRCDLLASGRGYLVPWNVGRSLLQKAPVSHMRRSTVCRFPFSLSVFFYVCTRACRFLRDRPRPNPLALSRANLLGRYCNASDPVRWVCPLREVVGSSLLCSSSRLGRSTTRAMVGICARGLNRRPPSLSFYFCENAYVNPRDCRRAKKGRRTINAPRCVCMERLSPPESVRAKVLTRSLCTGTARTVHHRAVALPPDICSRHEKQRKASCSSLTPSLSPQAVQQAERAAISYPHPPTRVRARAQNTKHKTKMKERRKKKEKTHATRQNPATRRAPPYHKQL